MQIAKLFVFGYCLCASVLSAAETSLWPGGDVSKDLADWKLTGPPGTKLRVEKEEFHGRPALVLDVPFLDGQDSWSVKVATEQRAELLAGKAYDISFSMKASEDFRVDVVVKGEDDSGRAHGRPALMVDWQEFTVTLTMEKTSQRLFLLLGELGRSESAIFFSNLRIVERE